MTFVGMYADTSPACVSMIGSAVSEPPGLRMFLPSTTLGVLAQLRGALEQTRVEIEHVARERLAARRATQHERELAIRGGLLGQVVVHAERRLALVVHEVLGHRAARVGRDVLHRRRVGRATATTTIVYSIAPASLQPLDDRRDRRRLLADRDVDADDALALLVDDRVDRDGRLAGAAVADDQLALAAADRDHRVDRLDAGLQRLLHRLADDDAGRLDLDLARRASR